MLREILATLTPSWSASKRWSVSAPSSPRERGNVRPRDGVKWRLLFRLKRGQSPSSGTHSINPFDIFAATVQCGCQWHNIEPVQNKTRRFKVSSLFLSGVQGNCSMFMSIFTHKFVPLIDIDFKCCKNVPLQCRHKHGSCWSTYSTQVGSGIIGYIYLDKVVSIIDIDFKFGYAAVLCVAAKLFIANHCDSNTKIKLIIRKTATKSWH